MEITNNPKPIAPTEKVMFGGDLFDFTEFDDGSKHLFIEKNSKGFKINLKISGDEKEHEIAHNALKNFFVKANL